MSDKAKQLNNYVRVFVRAVPNGKDAVDDPRAVLNCGVAYDAYVYVQDIANSQYVLAHSPVLALENAPDLSWVNSSAPCNFCFAKLQFSAPVAQAARKLRCG